MAEVKARDLRGPGQLQGPAAEMADEVDGGHGGGLDFHS